MYGGIIGDMVGSIYEFGQIKKVHLVSVDDLLVKNSFYSDDTILTVAILDAILNNQDYEHYLRMYIDRYQSYAPNFKPYFKTSFSPGLIKWAQSNKQGTSIGNGAMMRISPIGYLFNTEKKVIENAKLATIPSHNSKEAIDCATTIARIIYLARKNYSKEAIIRKLDLNLSYSPFEKFNSTCYATIDNCLYALFTSNNFEGAIKKVISFGGDTDTNACIVGSMAEAMYGIDEKLIVDCKKKLPKEFIEIIDTGYSKIKKI